MDTRNPGLSDYVRKSIDIAARKLIGKGGFTHDDLDDIRSEITLYTLRQLPRHDERQARLKTFVTMVVTDGAKHVIRDHLTEKRQEQRATASLDAAVTQDEDGTDITLLHLVGADETDILLGYRHQPRHEREMLRFEVASVVSGLPEELQACCAEIMNGRSFSEIARNSGLPRSTFRDRVITPLRSAFETAGLGEWL
jgi:DNA-directed RNA polymerase specialized sigma24 family protein